MRILPSSTIKVYSNIEIDGGEQIAFSSRENQLAYFNSHLEATIPNCTMIKKTGAIRLNVPGSTIKNCNYLSFTNPNFDDKEFYCRITDYDYTNNECVEVTYYIDYWQTWMFDVRMEDSYIEREHLSQSDFTKANSNPYDPSILEFQTDEPLPVGPEVEKRNYVIENDVDNTADGWKLFQASYAGLPSIIGRITYMGILVYLSPINFEYLDEGSSGDAQQWFSEFKAALKNSTATGMYYVDGVLEKGSAYASLGTNFGNRFPQSYWVFYMPFSLNAVQSGKFSFTSFINKLTEWNSISSIINMFAVTDALMARSLMFDVDGNFTPFHTNMHTEMERTGDDVTSKKLMLYPYSYMRLMTPDGGKKELRYEWFSSAQESNGLCALAVHVDINGRPQLVVAPVNYRFTNFDYNGTGENLEEAAIFGQFPTVPLNIDSFLAQVASVSSGLVSTNTGAWEINNQFQYEQNNFAKYKSNWDFASNMFSAVLDDNSSAATTIPAGVSAASSRVSVNLQTDYSERLRQYDEKMRSGAYSALSGAKDDTYVARSLNRTKPAFAANKYVPYSGDGLLNYSYMGLLDVIVLHVTLQPEILAKYDKYFMQFGYTSGRCGLPRVYNFTKGVSDESSIPHWDLVNDKYSTYCKTTNCKVIYTIKEVSDFITYMFNNGCRFINGDSLTGGE